MAATISASPFKAHCLGVMDQVAATGEVLVISKNGQPVAELHPCASGHGDPRGCARPDHGFLGRSEVIVLDTHARL